MIRIGFDAKRAFHNRSGLGNYSRDHLRMVNSYLNEYELHLYDPQPKQRKYQFEWNEQYVHSPHGGYSIFPALWRSSYLHHDLARDHIDIYHGLSNEIPLNLKGNRTKSVVSIHDLIFERFPEWYSKGDAVIYRKKFSYAAKFANRVVAISEQTKSDLVEFYNIPPEGIEVIYQSCHDVFKKPQSDLELEKVKIQYQLPSDFVLYVGTVEKRKNVKNLIQAMSQIDSPLVIVGQLKKEYGEEVLEMVHRLKMDQRVIFLSHIPELDLAAIFQLSKLFVYPSLFEGFGIPIIEALYSGTPVISSLGSCFSEAGGPDSLYIDPKNPDAILEGIIQVLDSEERQNQMIQKGSKYVERFELDTISKQWKSVYKSLES